MPNQKFQRTLEIFASDKGTLDCVENIMLPRLRAEIHEFDLANDTCEEYGLGRMFEEDVEQLRALLQRAETRLTTFRAIDS